jgi:ADP-ribosylglycohydrolase
MLGAIAGDIIGSIYEHANIKTKDFPLFGEDCRFTDDTVCTIAVADCLMNKGDFADYLGRYTLRHHTRGFGGMFMRWAKQWEREPYDSWGNGSAMRVSSVAHFAKDEGEVLRLAEETSAVTHSHPDGIAGAQATALAMWMAKEGADGPIIRQEITDRFGYDLTQSVDDIREWYTFDVSCAGSVPQAITCALEATDYEDAIRNAVSIGGDTDTIACIAGGIAEMMFGLPDEIAVTARGFLTDDLADVVDGFGERVRSFSEPNRPAVKLRSW